MIVPMLGIVMLSMGMTLTWSNFTEVLRRPAAIGLGVAPVFGHALPGLGGRPGAGSAATSDGGAGAAGGLSGRDRIESGLLSGQGRCCLLHHPDHGLVGAKSDGSDEHRSERSTATGLPRRCIRLPRLLLPCCRSRDPWISPRRPSPEHPFPSGFSRASWPNRRCSPSACPRGTRGDR